MTKKQKQEEWVRDLDARQSNIVFPDTAANEARFWRNLYEGKQKLTAVQAVGLALFAAMVLGMFIAVSLGWGHELYPTWAARIESAALDWILVAVILGGFMLLLKWGTRQRTKDVEQSKSTNAHGFECNCLIRQLLRGCHFRGSLLLSLLIVPGTATNL